MIQTAPDTETVNSGGSAENDTTALINDAAKAIERARGNAEFHHFYATLEGNTVCVVFDDFAVYKVFRYLLHRWLGSGDVLDSSENTTPSGVPRWVGEFRARALNVRTKGIQDPDDPAYLEQKRLSDLATKLANSVAPETPAQEIRRRFVEEVDVRIGQGY